MSIKVEYASRRREVWNWYCRTWRRELWKFHGMVFVAVGGLVGFLLVGDEGPTLPIVLAALACGLLSVAWMPAVPLLMFRPQLRSVEIDQDGISTTIDGESARRSWDEIQSISQEDGYIVMLGRKGSAFLIPPGAFETTDEQQRFLSFALDALGASLVRAA
jgi:YcxB-like protein